MEFYENGGAATARLLWSSTSTPKAAVPTAASIRRRTPPPTAILVNFQPAASPVPAGYLADGGLVYASRGNGQSYGWTIDNTAQTRDRERGELAGSALRHVDPHAEAGQSRRDLGDRASSTAPTGCASSSGDAANFDSVFRTTAEGVLVVNGTPTTATRWVEGTPP